MTTVTTAPVLPWPASKVHSANQSQIAALLPLVRPSMKVLEGAKGQTILIDTSASETKSQVKLVAIVPKDQTPSTSHLRYRIAAVSLGDETEPEELAEVLQKQGVDVSAGIVALRPGASKGVSRKGKGIVEVVVDSEILFDHALNAIGSCSGKTRGSLDQIEGLLSRLVKGAKNTTTRFSQDVINESPSITHESGQTAFEGAKAALTKDLDALFSGLGQVDGVLSVHYADINGLSRLENWILAYEIAAYLDEKKISHHISSSTIQEASFDGRGWTISICAVPQSLVSPQAKPSSSLAEMNGVAKSSASNGVNGSNPSKLQLKDADVRKKIESGCNAVIKAEPKITEYDTIVGDGDCGLTLRDGAQKVLDFVKDKDLANLSGVLTALVDDLEVTMGGTSGALYCIYLSALATNLQTASSVAEAIKAALDELCKYTKARVGDRTCMDCLIPFADTLANSGDVEKALAAAKEGTDKTAIMKANLGRSTYLDEQATKGVPDPGAYGLLVLLEGMSR